MAPAYPALTPPIFLGLASHRRCRRVLDLEPIANAAGAILRAQPLRHDPLAAERASVVEDDCAIASEMLIERDAVADASEELGECRFAPLERPPAQVHAVELNQIKGAQYGVMIAKPIAEDIEHRETVLVDHDGFTVEHARANRQAFDCGGDLGKARGEIVAIARKEANTPGIAPGEDAETVVLDFVNPAWSGWRFLGRAW